MKILHPFSLLVLALAVSASASTRRADRSDNAYIDLSNLSDYASVGQVSTSAARGSGTLISSSWMLTAAHVLKNSDGNKRFALGGVTYAIDNVIRFTDTFTLGKDDFALCHLSTLATGVQPALLWGGTGQVGSIGTSVGYGGTGTGLTGNTGAPGRRAFQNVVDGYNLGGLKGLSSDFDNPNGGSNRMGSPNPLDLEGCAVPGDSGGSLWEVFGGKSYVVGVTSYVWSARNPFSTPYGIYGDGSGYSQVADVKDWIFANSGVRTVNAVPEPASFAALGIAGGAFLRRRRRA